MTQFTEVQYRYLQTWNRSVDPKQRCRVVATGNPPTTPEGLWVLKYWAPWLDDEHPLYGEVAPGELVYYIIEDGKDTIVEDGCPVKVTSASGKTRWVLPRSRTFIPASVEANPFLMRTGYADQLAARHIRKLESDSLIVPVMDLFDSRASPEALKALLDADLKDVALHYMTLDSYAR